MCHWALMCAMGLCFVLQDRGLCHRILFCATGSWSVPNDLFLILQESPPTDYDWLIDSILFGVLLENSSSLLWERHHCRRRRLRNVGPCSVLTAFEAGEIFIVPRLLWQGFLAYRVIWYYYLIWSPFTSSEGSRGPLLPRNSKGCYMYVYNRKKFTGPALV